MKIDPDDTYLNGCHSFAVKFIIIHPEMEGNVALGATNYVATAECYLVLKAVIGLPWAHHVGPSQSPHSWGKINIVWLGADQSTG